jgi:hypothetical protein
MPIRSQAQAAWLAANRPDLFRQWQQEHPVDLSSLPVHAPPPKPKRPSSRSTRSAGGARSTGTAHKRSARGGASSRKRGRSSR